jgi:hypothetical protein
MPALVVALVVVTLLAALQPTVFSRAALAAEVLGLRHQLVVLRRHAPRRLRLSDAEPLVWVVPSRAQPE